ncbi:MAG: GerMN domain-containing protein [Eubacteriales bacterium]|nr:GerMN domain-containing protein [Eubacteriales bacterium]
MKRLIYMILSAMTACILLAGCQIEVQEDKKEETSGYNFYYINEDESDLKKEEYVPQEETADYMIPDLMQKLNNKTLQGGAVNLLPKDVQMNYTIEPSEEGGDHNSVLVIDFNNTYNDMSRAREILVRSGVVKTFIQVPGISAVRFTVGGKELVDTKGQPVGNMTASTFVELSGADKDNYRYDTFTLYFTDKSGSSLVEEKRNVGYRRSIPKERVILEQLAKGPMVKGHYPTIPENTGILSVLTSDNICYVNVDQVFSDYALEVPEHIAVYSVVDSLLASAEADKVKLSVGGDGEGTFGENMPLYNFYEWNDDLITVEESAQ